MNEPVLTLQQTRITDPFWFRVRETVRREGIPYQWKALNDPTELSFLLIILYQTNSGIATMRE